MRTHAIQIERLGDHKMLLVEQDREIKRFVSVGAVAALILSGWFSTFEAVIDEIIFVPANTDVLSAVVKIDVQEKKKPVVEKKQKPEDRIRKTQGSNAKSKPPRGNPQDRQTVAIMHRLQAMSSKPNLSVYDLMGKTFTKDMQKVLENTNVIRTSGQAVFGKRRGAVNGSFDGFSIEGSPNGIDDLLGGLLGKPSSIDTKAKSRIPIPKMSEITMSDGGSGRSVSEIMAVVRSHTPGLRYFYNKALKTNPGMAGKVTLRFTISPSGDVISMAIVDSSTGNSTFDSEISRAVQGWRWKAIKAGNTTVTIPFTFSE